MEGSMTMPKRIQRKRTRGWKMPDNTIYVGRPSIWGNPFWHAQKFHGLAKSLELYESMAQGIWQPELVEGIPSSVMVYADFQAWLKRLGGHPIEMIRTNLRGFDLACWCRLDQPCHADTLLRLANRETHQ